VVAQAGLPRRASLPHSIVPQLPLATTIFKEFGDDKTFASPRAVQSWSATWTPRRAATAAGDEAAVAAAAPSSAPPQPPPAGLAAAPASCSPRARCTRASSDAAATPRGQPSYHVHAGAADDDPAAQRSPRLSDARPRRSTVSYGLVTSVDNAVVAEYLSNTKAPTCARPARQRPFSALVQAPRSGEGDSPGLSPSPSPSPQKPQKPLLPRRASAPPAPGRGLALPPPSAPDTANEVR